MVEQRGMKSVASKLREKKLHELEKHIAAALQTLGYNLKDPNLRRTPHRVAKVWLDELLQPIKATKKLFTIFPEKHNQMITVIGHETWSRCAHHMERIQYKVSIGYIPDGRVIGASKLPRIADFFARGLGIQEAFTEDLAEGLYQALKPKGVGVYVRGLHHCMFARGVKSTGRMITTALKGVFLEDPATRNEFLYYCEREGL